MRGWNCRTHRGLSPVPDAIYGPEAGMCPEARQGCKALGENEPGSLTAPMHTSVSPNY